MWITIDDGPSPNVRLLLQYASARHLSGTLFCVGEMLQRRWDDALWALSHGWEIQNHSLAHPKFSDLDARQCRVEVEATEELIDQLYRSANRRRERRLFRYPWGLVAHRDVVESIGLTITGWTYDTADWRLAYGESAGSILERIEKNPPGEDDVVLMHDHVEKTELAFGMLDLLARAFSESKSPA